MSTMASSAPGMDLATVQSLSTGGAGLQSTLPATSQFSGSAMAEPISMSNFAGSYTPYIGALGTLAGTAGAIQGVRKGNSLMAGLGGGGAWLGLNAMGYTLGPAGWAMLAVPAVAALLNRHKSTREVTKENTGKLLKKSNDPGYQKYVQAMRAQYDSAPPDPSKPFHGGQYATWDEYKNAGLDAGDLTGVKANLGLGPEYTNLNFDQQKAVTQAAIDANLYNSRKGEVEADQNKLRQIFDNVKNGGFKIPVVPPKPAVVNTVTRR